DPDSHLLLTGRRASVEVSAGGAHRLRPSGVSTRRSHAPANGADAPDARTRPVLLRNVDGLRQQQREDLVACEEPLEIQLGPASLAVVMRTPGNDEELALGFLITERIVSSAADVVSVRHCTTSASAASEDNIVRAVLAPHVEVDLAALRRNLYASS